MEGAAGQQVHVQVWHSFPGVGAIIDYDAKAVFQLVFNRQITGGKQQMPESGLVPVISLGDAGDGLVRNDKEMHRGLRIDVLDHKTVVILMKDRRGDFTVTDFFKEGFFAHGLEKKKGESGGFGGVGRRHRLEGGDQTLIALAATGRPAARFTTHGSLKAGD
jgi:hypothetical protein